MRKELLKNAAAPLRKHGRFENLLRITPALRGRAESMQYQVVIPHATYSPWWGGTRRFRTSYRMCNAQRSSTCIASMSCGSWLNR